MVPGGEFACSMPSRGKGKGAALSTPELLCKKVAALEAQLYAYQYNMGLLLIEKKQWALKIKKLKQALGEAQAAIKCEQAANLKILSEVESKNYAANTMIEEASKKTTEIDQKLQELEIRSSALRQERFSFMEEKVAQESSLVKREAYLCDWERKLQDEQRRLLGREVLLNKRESSLTETERLITQKEMNVEVSRRKISEAAYLELKKNEDATVKRLVNFEAREKAANATCKRLELEEQKLLHDTENLSNKLQELQNQLSAEQIKLRLEKELVSKTREDLKQDKMKFEKLWEDLEDEKGRFNRWNDLEARRLEREISGEKKVLKDLQALDIDKSNGKEAGLSAVQIDETKNLSPQQSFGGSLSEHECGLASAISPKVTNSKSDTQLAGLEICSGKILGQSLTENNLLKSSKIGSDQFIRDSNAKGLGVLETEVRRQDLSSAVDVVDETIDEVTDDASTADGKLLENIAQSPVFGKSVVFKLSSPGNNARDMNGGRLRETQSKQIMKKYDVILATLGENCNRTELTDLQDGCHNQTSVESQKFSLYGQSKSVTTEGRKMKCSTATKQYNLRRSTICSGLKIRTRS